MKFIIPEKKGECENLQHQEEKKIRISSDEEKYVSHKTKFKVKPRILIHDC
jgi:hypothetical protein